MSVTEPSAAGSRRDAFLGTHHTLVQGAVDALSDLAGAPIILARARPVDVLFVILSSTVPDLTTKVATPADLENLVALANSDTSKLLHILSADTRFWRPIFETIEADVILIRSGRMESILRLLRHHWTWKWVEILAIYGRLLETETSARNPGFFERYAHGIWKITALPDPISAVHIVIGPTKSLHTQTAASAAVVRAVIEQFYSDISGVNAELGPIYSTDRYEQFLHDTSPAPRAAESEIAENIRFLLSSLPGVKWPETRPVDMADSVALATLSYFVASPPHRQVGCPALCCGRCGPLPVRPHRADPQTCGCPSSRCRRADPDKCRLRLDDRDRPNA
jgi:hypothetical protein